MKSLSENKDSSKSLEKEAEPLSPKEKSIRLLKGDHLKDINKEVVEKNHKLVDKFLVKLLTDVFNIGEDDEEDVDYQFINKSGMSNAIQKLKSSKSYSYLLDDKIEDVYVEVLESVLKIFIKSLYDSERIEEESELDDAMDEIVDVLYPHVKFDSRRVEKPFLKMYR